MKLYAKEPKSRQKSSGCGCGSGSEDLWQSRRQSATRRHEGCAHEVRTSCSCRSQRHRQQRDSRNSSSNVSRRLCFWAAKLFAFGARHFACIRSTRRLGSVGCLSFFSFAPHPQTAQWLCNCTLQLCHCNCKSDSQTVGGFKLSLRNCQKTEKENKYKLSTTRRRNRTKSSKGK